MGSAEKKLHVEKALSAARIAVEGGIVPGGGIALLKTIPALNDLETESKDEALGVTMVREAPADWFRRYVVRYPLTPDVPLAGVPSSHPFSRTLQKRTIVTPSFGGAA